MFRWRKSATKLKFILLAMPLITATSVLRAQEQDSFDQQEVQVNGRVAPICVLGEPVDKVINLGNMIDTSGPRIGRIAAIAPRTVIMPNSFCNYGNTTVSISATALTEQGGAAMNSGFSRAVNYRIAVGPWASEDAVVETSTTASGSSQPMTIASASQALPKLVDLTMRLSDFSSAADALLVAGNYAGTIVITLGPAGQSN